MNEYYKILGKSRNSSNWLLINKNILDVHFFINDTNIWKNENIIKFDSYHFFFKHSCINFKILKPIWWKLISARADDKNPEPKLWIQKRFERYEVWELSRVLVKIDRTVSSLLVKMYIHYLCMKHWKVEIFKILLPFYCVSYNLQSYKCIFLAACS